MTPENLDIVIEDPRWDAAGLAGLAGQAVAGALVHLGLDPARVELTVLGCDDPRIATLNSDFRDKPNPTNVLSWPAQDLAPALHGDPPQTPRPDPDGMITLGDIALSYDTCAAEADAAGLQMQHHTTHLIVHGVLHLLGYDHIFDPDAALMEQLEIEILGKMGVDDPYREDEARRD